MLCRRIDRLVDRQVVALVLDEQRLAAGLQVGEQAVAQLAQLGDALARRRGAAGGARDQRLQVPLAAVEIAVERLEQRQRGLGLEIVGVRREHRGREARRHERERAGRRGLRERAAGVRRSRRGLGEERLDPRAVDEQPGVQSLVLVAGPAQEVAREQRRIEGHEGLAQVLGVALAAERRRDEVEVGLAVRALRAVDEEVRPQVALRHEGARDRLVAGHGCLEASGAVLDLLAEVLPRAQRGELVDRQEQHVARRRVAEQRDQVREHVRPQRTLRERLRVRAVVRCEQEGQALVEPDRARPVAADAEVGLLQLLRDLVEQARAPLRRRNVRVVGILAGQRQLQRVVVGGAPRVVARIAHGREHRLEVAARGEHGEGRQRLVRAPLQVRGLGDELDEVCLEPFDEGQVELAQALLARRIRALGFLQHEHDAGRRTRDRATELAEGAAARQTLAELPDPALARVRLEHGDARRNALLLRRPALAQRGELLLADLLAIERLELVERVQVRVLREIACLEARQVALGMEHVRRLRGRGSGQRADTEGQRAEGAPDDCERHGSDRSRYHASMSKSRTSPARAVVEAAQRADRRALERLVQAGADLDVSWRGYRALHALIQEDPHAEEQPLRRSACCLVWLLEHAADPGARRRLASRARPARRGLQRRSALRRGARARMERRVDVFARAALGDLAGVQRELAKDPSLATARDGGALTALQCAAASRLGKHDAKLAKNLLAIATLLLDAGADPNARTKSWSHEVDTAYFACNANNPALLELLLARGADATAALPSAAWRKTMELAEICLAHGARIDDARAEGRALVNELVRWGQVTPALWLLEKGASPNLPDERGWTALHQAASRGNERMMKALLAAGGDRTRKDANGHTPLAIAVLARKAKMVELLGAR